MLSRHHFRRGDRVVCTLSKFSARPGPRARDVRPASGGEGYSYCVDKYWVIEAVRPDGLLVARTRRGKIHVLDPAHRGLRHARWWQRWLLADRFPPLADAAQDGTVAQT